MWDGKQTGFSIIINLWSSHSIRHNRIPYDVIRNLVQEKVFLSPDMNQAIFYILDNDEDNGNFSEKQDDLTMGVT